MNITDPQPAAVPKPKLRWFHLTPDRIVIGLLVVECLLWLSDRFRLLPAGVSVLVVWMAIGLVAYVAVLKLLLSVVLRRQFQFGIRALLILTIAVALACSWLAAEEARTNRQAAAVTEIKKLGGGVLYTLEFPPRPPLVPQLVPEWLRGLLGEEFFLEVVGVGFDKTKVTDDGLRHVKGLTRLKVLWLHETRITDIGLEYLKNLTPLRELDLTRTKVSAEGVKKLQQALPNCKIDWSLPTPDERQSPAKPDQPGG